MWKLNTPEGSIVTISIQIAERLDAEGRAGPNNQT